MRAALDDWDISDILAKLDEPAEPAPAKPVVEPEQTTAEVIQFPENLGKLFAGKSGALETAKPAPAQAKPATVNRSVNDIPKLKQTPKPQLPASADGGQVDAAANSDNQTDDEPALGYDAPHVIEAVEKLNEDHFIALDGGRARVFVEYFCPELKRPAMVGMMKEAFHDLRANQFLKIETETSKGELKTELKTISKVWFSHGKRRQYINGMAMLPGQEAPAGVYNLWRGWGVDAIEGDCQPQLNHVFEVICNGCETSYNYVIGWMAYTIQHPDRQAGTCIVLRGGEGAGKGTLAQWLGKIFGLHFAHLTKAKHLVGDFNQHLRTALFTFADEALFAGDHAAANYLKALVTEDHLQIEGKGRDIITVANLIKLMMSSNSDWVVPAGADSRRYCVLDVSNKHKQDKPYFDRLITHSKNGGIEALFHYLLNYDLSSFDIRAIPDTSGLSKQRMLSMPAKSQWLFDLLQGDWYAKPQTKDSIHQSFVEFVKLNGTRYENLSANSLGMFLKDVFGLELKTIETSRPRMWGFPDQARARELFVKYAGLTHVDWSE